MVISFLLSFCLGLVIYSFWQISLSLFLVVGFVLLIIFLILIFPKNKKYSVFCFFALFLGFIYASFFKPQTLTPPKNMQGVVNGFYTCSTTQCICPLKDDKTKYSLTIEKDQNFLCLPGNVLAVQGKAKVPKYKSEILAKGIGFYIQVDKIKLVQTNDNLWFRFLRFLLGVKIYFSKAIDNLFAFSEAVFAKGLVLGEKQNFSTSFKQNLQNTGTSHLVALSGFNISILILALFYSLSYFSKKLAFAITTVSILGFILMTGAPTSVVRAGIVGEFLILGQILGRQNDSGLILVWSLFFIGLFSPFALVYDVSLQLSFSAFLGIVYLAPLIVKRISFLGFLGGLLSQTLGAIIFTLPLVAYYFGKISLIAILPNILVVAVVPLATYLIIFSAIFYFISLPLAKFLAFVSQVFLSFSLWVINSFGSIHFASIGLKINSAFWLLPYYFILTIFLIVWWQKEFKIIENEKTNNI